MAEGSLIGLLFANAKNAISTSFALVIFYFLSVAVFNVFFHPLRKYPGPLLWRAFRFPNIWANCTGRLPPTVRALHEKYDSPIIRVAPDELSYTDPAAWKEIYGFRKDHTQLPKDLIVLPNPNPNGAKNIITGNDETHSRFRKLLSHAFSAKALEEQEDFIKGYVDLLIKRLHEKCAEPQNMMAWYNWTTFDLIGDLAFGEPFGCLEKSEWHPFVKRLVYGINSGIILSATQRYGAGGLLRAMLPHSLWEERAAMLRTTQEKVARRLEKGTERPDFMSFIMREDKNQELMSVPELNTNAEVLLVAGSETTATLLSGATYFLVKNPDILRKVTAEVRDAFSQESEITFAESSKLGYLGAVLNETFRMYPPAPGVIPRIVQAHQGESIAGEWVPPQTIVGVTQYAINYSERNYSNPTSFKPERWLPDPPEEFANDQKEALQPFSAGPRNCIGKNLAYLEMRTIMARVLWNFDMELQPESEKWLEQKVYLIWDKLPLMVKLKPVMRK